MCILKSWIIPSFIQHYFSHLPRSDRTSENTVIWLDGLKACMEAWCCIHTLLTIGPADDPVSPAPHLVRRGRAQHRARSSIPPLPPVVSPHHSHLRSVPFPAEPLPLRSGVISPWVQQQIACSRDEEAARGGGRGGSTGGVLNAPAMTGRRPACLPEMGHARAGRLKGRGGRGGGRGGGSTYDEGLAGPQAGCPLSLEDGRRGWGSGCVFVCA